jgi:DMSO/TMAO reductase YedYZ molybdopterin-dependent catalytic subunit
MTKPPLAADAPLVVVRPHPLCAETPAARLVHAITPRESVYVRSNFDVPPSGALGTLRVDGAVSQPFSLTVAELAALPQREVLVTMECAGNWRLAMRPVPPGEPWQWGAVSTTTWRGVPLRALLERAGVAPDAVEVVGHGADSGPRDDAEGIVPFARALPLAVAQHPDVLVATHMDGVPLTPGHGAPLRLIVPGWYGMANVKWLVRLEIGITPFAGYFQRQRYVYDTEQGVTPVQRARVKSFVVHPAEGRECDAEVEIRGWAWSGSGAITRVEVGVNGVWHDAELGAPAGAHAWTPFVLRTVLPEGAVTLASRAYDASGAVQPQASEWNRLGYGNNAVREHLVRVQVKSGLRHRK